jgi:hypothetical protein
MSAIKVNDLVVVISVPCTCMSEMIGMIFTVIKIDLNQPSRCALCRKKEKPATHVIMQTGDRFAGILLYCLKKIEPLPEHETDEIRDEVVA